MEGSEEEEEASCSDRVEPLRLDFQGSAYYLDSSAAYAPQWIR